MGESGRKSIQEGKNMRKYKTILKFIAILIFFTVTFTGCINPSENHTLVQKEHSTDLFAMDTYIKLTAYGEQAQTALELSGKKIKELESLWSVTDENSEIYKVNHSKGDTVKISSETAQILKFTLKMAKQTNGALDPTIYPVLTAWGFTTTNYRIPSEEEISRLLKNTGYKKILVENDSVILPEGAQIDLGAIGKGYTGDIIANLMREHEVSSALLNIGGNIQAVGSKPDGSKWSLGMKNPFGDGIFGVLEIEDCAVVTSGSYERYFIGEDGRRYCHIIDTSTGHPAENGLVSVSVIAKEGKLGDALSTALFVMGLDDAVKYWQNNSDFEMLLVTEDREIYVTEGIENNFALDQDYNDMKVHVIRR